MLCSVLQLRHQLHCNYVYALHRDQFSPYVAATHLTSKMMLMPHNCACFCKTRATIQSLFFMLQEQYKADAEIYDACAIQLCMFL